MYSTDGEVGDDDHYPDFLATTAFLMDDPERLGRFEGDLRAYRRALQRAMQGDADGIEAARAPVERELRRVMVRTERVAATEDRCGMLREVEIHAPLAPEDVRQYAVVDAVARALDEADPIELWKSAPYLLNFMKGYKLKERLDESLRRPDVADALRRGREDLLPRRTIKHYGEVEPSNPRLRALADEMLGRERWRLLWVPPSLPYRPFRPPFDTAGARFTKALVFSAWNVVPDAVSALLSYEAERRMLGSRDVTYALLHRQVRPLLRYAVSEGRASGMPVLALSYPCLRLADEVSPLELRLRHGESFGTAIQEQVVGLVASLQDGEGATDERWYWAVPLLLDQVRGGRAFLESWMLERLVEGGEGEDEAGRDEGSQFRRHAAEALDLIEGKTRLGRKPADLVGVVSELALGAPGILAARSLRCVGAGDEARRRAAARVGEGFRSLFNQPAATALIRREMPDDLPYWRAVLQYADAGNLQALLDEYLHQLREQGGWNHADPDEAAERLGAEMADAATIKTSRVGAEVYRVHGSAARAVRLNLRTGFALRYGVLRTDAQEVQARENAVRLAFNSPFHPFVLATTSVGQEGLDFHTWCHAVYHWNLPGNPVDLEQREGRVHRYKGHAIRRNVAAKLGLGALAGRWVPGDDPWERLFECAIERFSRGDELVPCWVFDGDHKVERRLPLLPYSREVERFRRLKRDLVAYRVVFGQPRQQELLEALRHTGLGAEAIGRWVLDLRPRGGEGRRCGEAR
jgi:hypothetical protein